MAGNSVGVSAVEGRSWWCRPAAWPDGRLFNPNEDRTARVGLGVAFLLLAVYLWVLGRSDSFGMSVGDSSWILAGGLLVASALCILVTRKRVWARAINSGAGATWPEAPDRILTDWVRAPRWPDGRRFMVRDPVVTAATWASVLTACAAVWLFGEAGIPRIDISAYQDPLVPLMQLAMSTTILVVVIRQQVVQAVVEGWADDDRELSFVAGRIAALAASAKRAKAHFAPSNERDAQELR